MSQKVSEKNLEPSFTELIDIIRLRLLENKKIRRTLPGGRIHIDRQLPFLCIFRHPPDEPDKATERLVMGEASYLVASGDPAYHEPLKALVHEVVGTLSNLFGSFLVVEIWVSSNSKKTAPKIHSIARPTFRILTRDKRYGPFDWTLFALEGGLKNIRLLKTQPEVEIDYRVGPYPPNLESLLSHQEAKRFNCKRIGVEIRPVYRGKKGEIFPLVLRSFRRGVASAFKEAFYEFVRTYTTHRPKNYQALGRRAVVKAVWDVDRQLAEISSAFDFLFLTTPVNADVAWNYFRRKKFQAPPIFHYRPLPVDPVQLKQKLFEIPVVRIEDPTLDHLLREKQTELDQKLTLLMNRGSRKFLYGSLALYGEPDDSLYRLAQRLMKRLGWGARRETSGKSYDAIAFADRARQEIDYFKKKYREVTASVHLRDDVLGNFVLRGDMLIGKRTKVPLERVEALIQHEVGTHLLTYYNGRAQPFKQLYTGLAGYEELQEGLAVFAEYLSGGLTPSRFRVIAARIIAAKHLVDGASFIETFRYLIDQHQFDSRIAFNIAMRVYRSGGLTKDIIYLRGLVQLLDYFQKGGSIEPLLIGKIGLQHVPIVEELIARKVLKKAPLRPRYLDSDEIAEKMAQLKKGLKVEDLVENGNDS